MRILTALLFGTLLFVSNCGERRAIVSVPENPKVEQTPAAPVVVEKTSIDFKPVGEMLGRSCTPCHNPGGKMYATLPFDNPEIVSSHGESILGRIKAPEDHELLKTWLASKKP
jgi:hypothetical protein